MKNEQKRPITNIRREKKKKKKKGTKKVIEAKQIMKTMFVICNKYFIIFRCRKTKV